jgi:hypothetical protein
MTVDEVYSTVCPGGYFIVVTLNNRPELKKLAPLDTSKDDVEAAFDRAEKTSVANAIKQARKTARANAFDAEATATAVEHAKARVTAAFDAVEDIFEQAVCPIYPHPAFARHPKTNPQLVTAQ